MDAQQIVNAALKAASAVTTIASTRVYPVIVPVGAGLPAVAIDVRPGGTVGGNVLANAVAIDVACIAHVESDMHGLVEAVQATLEGYAGGADSTYLRHLYRDGYAESYDSEFNVWSGIVTFSGILIGA